MKIAEEVGKHGLCNVSSWTFRMHCQRRLYSKYLWVQMERYRNTNRPLTMSNYRSNAIGVINMATLVESRLPEGNQGKTELEHEKEESVPMEEKKVILKRILYLLSKRPNVGNKTRMKLCDKNKNVPERKKHSKNKTGQGLRKLDITRSLGGWNLMIRQIAQEVQSIQEDRQIDNGKRFYSQASNESSEEEGTRHTNRRG